MQLIWTFIGILATWTVLKFVFMVFKRLGSKSNMNDFLDRAEDKMGEMADEVAGYWKKKKRRTTKKKVKIKEEPIVTIR